MIDGNGPLICVLPSCRCPGAKLPAAPAERHEGRQSGQVAAADVHAIHTEWRSAAEGVRPTGDGLGQRQRDPSQLQPTETESGASGKQSW